ncbi:hypothetical protein ZWY2020_018416 [Hordeum vulgare]|nr:hypothetical protein ZWY2020_018416 [Hordeum vulgare]
MGAGRARTTSVTCSALYATRARSSHAGGVVDEWYIHQRARCLGSGESCVSRIAHCRTVGDGMLKPAGKACFFSAMVMTFTRPRAWFRIIYTLGNQRAISQYWAHSCWLLWARSSTAFCQPRLPSIADFDRREGEGIGGASGEWVEIEDQVVEQMRLGCVNFGVVVVVLEATFDCMMTTYGFVTPDFWRETTFTKAPYQECTDILAKPTKPLMLDAPVEKIEV